MYLYCCRQNWGCNWHLPGLQPVPQRLQIQKPSRSFDGLMPTRFCHNLTLPTWGFLISEFKIASVAVRIRGIVKHTRTSTVDMRFKTSLKNIRTFSKLVAALSSLEKIAWVRLDDETVRFTVIPDTGSQVWASLSSDLIFENWSIQSAEPNNTINLELPLVPLQRALKSAASAVSASLRLTKKDGLPVLSMTITTSTAPTNQAQGVSRFGLNPANRAASLNPHDDDGVFAAEPLETSLHREHEKVITQDIPVRVLHPETVESIMQPKVREPDVHIQLPPLLQLKAISDRFTKLAVASKISPSASASSASPKLELSANMHGNLRLRLDTDTLDVESRWDRLENPELDPGHITCAIEDHPSTRFKNAGPNKWATVRVDGKDWSKVLSIGRLDGRVIACFADDHALILYVYVPNNDDLPADDSVITYYVSSYSL
ncbi:checkpoint protein Hus1/Mec3 [Xylariaceae sp. FL0594]|nr:checkpoint protein Hus1/Mec3 [Xylariaceae sp. FL0594]